MITGAPTTPFDYGAVGDGVADDTAAISAMLNSGKSVYVPDGEFLITSPISSTVSDISIYCDGFFVFDWASIGAAHAITLSGDNLSTRLYAKALSSAYVLTNKVTLASYACFKFTGNNCDSSYGKSYNNPIFLLAQFTPTPNNFSASHNYGYSVIDGSVLDAIVFNLIQVDDGAFCDLDSNSGYGFGQGILIGSTTNEVVVTNNNFWDCSNASVYVSSCDKGTIHNNTARGINTDIKARGADISMVGNSVFGGVLACTNRVVDVGNGYGINSAQIMGNTVISEGSNAYAISCVNNTGDNCAAGTISVKSNTVLIRGSGVYGIFVSFLSMDAVSIVGNSINTEVGMTLTDGILVTPTTTNDPTLLNNMVIANNVVIGSMAQGIQANGASMIISGNNLDVTGGSGASSGAILVSGEKMCITGNVASVSNNVQVMKLYANASSLAMGNTLTRASGSVLAHIYSEVALVIDTNVKV